MKPIQGRFKTSDTFFNILMVTFFFNHRLYFYLFLIMLFPAEIISNYVSGNKILQIRTNNFNIFYEDIFNEVRGLITRRKSTCLSGRSPLPYTCTTFNSVGSNLVARSDCPLRYLNILKE